MPLFFRRSALLAGLLALAAFAARAAVLDGVPGVREGVGPGSVQIDIGDKSVRPLAPTGQRQAGNPLWAIPLQQLSVTRERPIFSPSRRPPAPAVAVTPRVEPPAPSPVVQRPQLSLVGTIVSDAQSFGIFLEDSDNNAVRLKTGEVHQGWTLLEVRPREIVLQKGDRTVTLSLPPVAATSGPVVAARDDDRQRDRRSLTSP